MKSQLREYFSACIFNYPEKLYFFSAHNLSKQNKTSVIKPFLQFSSMVFNRFSTFFVE